MAGTYREPYPLAEKKNGGARRVKALLTQLTDKLLDKVQHELLYDEVLLPWMIEWVGIMTNQSHRGMRHTASEVAMTMISKLAEIKSGVAQKVRAPSLRLPCTLDLTCT